MIDINDAIYLKLKNDATLSGITGKTSSDARVYPSWPDREIRIDNAQPAYIAIFDTTIGSPELDCEHPSFQISVFAKRNSTAVSARSRIIDLLDKATLTASAHTVVKIARGTSNHLFEDDTKRHHWATIYEIRAYET